MEGVNFLKFKLHYIIAYFTSVAYCVGQNSIDNIFLSLKQENFRKAYLLTQDLKNKNLQDLFNYQIEYQTNGQKSKIEPLEPKKSNKKEELVYKLLLADYYTSLKLPKKDSLIFRNYLYSYNEALKINDSVIIRESLKKINKHIAYRSRDTVAYKKYLELYENYVKDSIDLFWLNYYKIGYQFIKTELKTETINTLLMNELYSKLKDYSDENTYLRGLYHQSLGIYQSHWLKDYSTANVNNLEALTIYERIKYWYSQTKINGLKFNTAINYYKNNEPRKAIPFFKADLKRDKEKILAMYTNEWLSKSYEAVKEYDSSLYYFKEMNIIKEEIDKRKHSREIKRIEGEYNYEDKVKQLEELSKENSNLQTSLLSIFPLLGIVSILLVLSFYLFKRYKKKSHILEEEQSQTLQKLDELKSIVIKNHIVLKDKTKVYVSDLMYIKSDDHYLEIITQDAKKHTVRGKLSDIKEELPPNFIQCHRSYIVNSNFIKQTNSSRIILINKEQIPLSRSFRTNFK